MYLLPRRLVPCSHRCWPSRCSVMDGSGRDGTRDFFSQDDEWSPSHSVFSDDTNRRGARSSGVCLDFDCLDLNSQSNHGGMPHMYQGFLQGPWPPAVSGGYPPSGGTQDGALPSAHPDPVAHTDLNGRTALAMLSISEVAMDMDRPTETHRPTIPEAVEAAAMADLEAAATMKVLEAVAGMEYLEAAAAAAAEAEPVPVSAFLRIRVVVAVRRGSSHATAVTSGARARSTRANSRLSSGARGKVVLEEEDTPEPAESTHS